MSPSSSQQVKIGVAVFLLLVLVEVLIQYTGHAWQASYGSYPDEPSHFLSALLVRDYVASGGGNPMAFAKDYYTHQPYFAIGYWPPLFYLVAGGWMLLFGYSRLSMMGLTGAIAVTVAWLLYEAARRLLRREVENTEWASVAWAVPTAIFFLLIPSVQWSSSLVMVDLLVALVSLLTTFAFGRFFQNPQLRTALLAGAFAGTALLTKYSAVFVLLPPVILLLVDRRWFLLKKPSTWVIPATMLALWGPWVYWSRRFTTIGVDVFHRETFWPRLKSAYASLNSDFGSIFGICVMIVLVGALFQWKSLSATHRLLALQLPCVVFFLFLAPVTIEQRYLLTAYPALLTLFPLMVYRWFGHLPQLLWWGPLVFSVSTVFFWVAHPSNMSPLMSPLVKQIAQDVLAETNPQQAAVLIGTAIEGPLIAELASIETRRPDLVMVRSSKLLARMNWLGTQYEAIHTNDREIQDIFDQYPMDTIVMASRAGMPELPHEVQLQRVLAGDAAWKRLKSYRDVDGSRYELYKRSHSAPQPISSLLSFLQGRLPKVQ